MVVCGSLVNLFNFVQPLRSRTQAFPRAVVFLSLRPPPAEEVRFCAVAPATVGVAHIDCRQFGLAACSVTARVRGGACVAARVCFCVFVCAAVPAWVRWAVGAHLSLQPGVLRGGDAAVEAGPAQGRGAPGCVPPLERCSAALCDAAVMRDGRVQWLSLCPRCVAWANCTVLSYPPPHSPFHPTPYTPIPRPPPPHPSPVECSCLRADPVRHCASQRGPGH